MFYKNFFDIMENYYKYLEYYVINKFYYNNEDKLG